MTNAAIALAVIILAAFIYWLSQRLGAIEIAGVFLAMIFGRKAFN